MVKIFIDPGHGGSDPGTTGNGLKEKELTLEIATHIKNFLLSEYNNVMVKMSRIDDSYLTLTERTNEANAWGADYFLSIHINAGGGEGYEDYIYPGISGVTKAYQSTIHSEIMKLVDFKDRGKKTANFHVLRESNMPALLTENGFIDNSRDAAKLKSASYIDAIARGHVNGLAKSFALTRKNKAVYHNVVYGDTVYSLSKIYGSTISQIKNWNGLDDDYKIIAGDKIRVL